MNLFSPLMRLFGIGTLSNADEGPQVGTSRGTNTQAGISVTDEQAMRVSAVWACVNYIANSVCSLPIKFYQQRGPSRDLLGQHYLGDLFHKSPNSTMKPRDFRKAMTTQMILWSNAYAEIQWLGERAVSLTPLRPGRMEPFLMDGEITYHYKTANGIKVYSKQSILHLKGLTTEGIVGLERTEYARDALGLSVSAETYAASQFANGGRSGGGYIYFDQFLNPKQREQARNLYSGMSEGAANKGKLWLLEGGAKYEPDTVNPDSMQMIETRKLQLGEISRFFGVPEILVGGGSTTSAWPSSFEQQLLFFITFTLQDYLDEWESAISYSLVPNGQKNIIFADHDVSQFIKMDSVSKANIQSTWVQNGLKTRNEIRKLNNDPPIEGGDDLTVQVNLTPVDQLEAVSGTTIQ